ncbi:MAG: hypothetical protein ACOH19_16800 [Rhodoglobus sp.]
MRTVTPILAAGIAAALAITLSGCFGDTPSYTPAAEPTAAPLFASDEEALAAAEEAYRAYYEVSDQILNDGGNEPERLLKVATQQVVEFESESFTAFRESGYRSAGATVVDSVRFQAYDALATYPEAIVTIYACIDVSETDVLDKSGTSVVEPGRQERLPFEVTFTAQAGASPFNLVVSGEEQWNDSNLCA